MIVLAKPMTGRIVRFAVLYLGFWLNRPGVGQERPGGTAASSGRAGGADLRVEGRAVFGWTAQGCRRPASADEGRLDRGGLGRPAQARL